jgi:hypothetical protein
MKNKELIIGFMIIIGIFLISPVSAATYTLLDYDYDIEYSSSNYNYNVYFNSYSGYVSTSGYRQIYSVKITDIYGYSKTLLRNRDFKNSKSKYGYSTSIDFDNDKLGLSSLKTLEVRFVKQSDLRIMKTKKRGNYYYVTVKNYGDATARSSYLGTYIYSKKTKKTYIPSLKPGKYKTVKIYAKTYFTKTFKADCTNLVNEVYESNNERFRY